MIFRLTMYDPTGARSFLYDLAIGPGINMPRRFETVDEAWNYIMTSEWITGYPIKPGGEDTEVRLKALMDQGNPMVGAEWILTGPAFRIHSQFVISYVLVDHNPTFIKEETDDEPIPLREEISSESEASSSPLEDNHPHGSQFDKS